ncbi:MAG: histone deacetylase family protein [Ilumatobacter sp.]|uniref:histone deacetylase family protein n=1 Tax=Ilumatobacter sp. TaxID=1967498 RepID=UPI0032998869
MLIIASDEHRGHRYRELHNGEMVDGFERPERADLIAAALRSAGHHFVEPGPVDRELLGRVHTPAYVELLETAWARWVGAGHTATAAMGFMWPTGGFTDREPADIVGLLGRHSFSADTSIVAGTWAAVASSAAIATTAADRTLDDGETAYGLCRPPGHHAGRDRFGGYCLVNNAAVAAQRLRDRGMGRVGVLDVDYHHGNGTQEIFYARDDVVFVSIHADPVEEFPWFAGFPDERGSGDGEGANLNLALARGTGRAEWFAALAVALERLRGLDALVVSLGVDTFEDDPLGTFHLTTDDFGRMATEITGLGTPTAIVQEGGYESDDLGRNVAAFLAHI